MTYKQGLEYYLLGKNPQEPAKNTITEELSQPDQMSIGFKIEHEHLPTYEFIEKTLKETGKLPPKEEVFKHIASDHLTEIKDYYTRLVKMEKEAGK